MSIVWFFVGMAAGMALDFIIDWHWKKQKIKVDEDIHIDFRIGGHDNE